MTTSQYFTTVAGVAFMVLLPFLVWDFYYHLQFKNKIQAIKKNAKGKK